MRWPQLYILYIMTIFFGRFAVVSHANERIKINNCFNVLLETSLLIQLPFTAAHCTPGPGCSKAG